MSDLLNIIIIIIGIILIVYVIYLAITDGRSPMSLRSATKSPVPVIPLFEPLKIHPERATLVAESSEMGERPSVLIFKTHLWHDELEKFAKKLERETVPYGIDYYILMHSDDYTLKDKIIDPHLKQRVLMYSETDIKKMYDKGFFSMWLSNHWILMWFYYRYPKYRYYWSMEYDVRIVGDSSKIWTYPGDEDFIYPVKPFQDPTWVWRNHYSGFRFTNNTKWYGYLQLTRYSNKFLKYLDDYFELGENGQDEMMLFSIYKRGKTEINLTGSHKFLNNLIKDSWSVNNEDSDKHKKILADSIKEYEKDKDYLIILHPVKQ